MLPTASTMRKRDGSEPHNHARGAPSSGGKHKKRQATRRLYHAGTTTGAVGAAATSTAGGGVSAASLEDSASWLSWLTFSWCNPIIDALYRGARLTEADLPPPAAGDDPSEVVRAFDDEWNRCRDQSKPLALASTLFRVHRRRYGLFCGEVCPSPVNTARSRVSACWVCARVCFTPICLRGHPASLLMALCWQVFGVVSSLCKPLIMARMLDVFATWASVADVTADATAAALAPSLGHALWLCALLTFASAGQSTGDQTVCRRASTAWQDSSPMRVGVYACMCMVCACVFACVCDCMWLHVAAVDHMQCFYMCCRVGIHTGVALQSKVFDKALRLSNPARRKFPLGHITTVLSSDANSIADQEASTFLVLSACLAVCLLHVTVDPTAAFVGCHLSVPGVDVDGIWRHRRCSHGTVWACWCGLLVNSLTQRCCPCWCG